MFENEIDGMRSDEKTKSLFSRLNINDPVLVKLTDAGRDARENEHHNDMFRPPCDKAYKPKYEDKDGYSTWTIAELIKVYGGYIFEGSAVLFEGDLMVPRKIHDV